MNYKLIPGKDHSVEVADEKGRIFLHLSGPGDGASDFLEIKGDLIFWERRVERPVREMVMEVLFLEPCVHTMIPAVLYDGNPFGHDHEYKGFFTDGKPWVIAGHRTSVPAASCAEGQVHSIALWSGDGGSVSMFPLEKGSIHRLIWPLQEGPKALMSDGWGSAWKEEEDPRLCFRARIVLGGTGRQAAFRRMLSAAWQEEMRKRLPGPPADTERIWNDSVSFAKLLYTEEEDGFRGFAIGLEWDGRNWKKRKENRYEAAWCGQNISLALSLLMHSRFYGDREAERMALNTVSSWLTMALSSSGLYRTRYDGDGTIDACNLGDYICQLFFFAGEKRIQGLDSSREEEAARQMLSFIMKDRGEGGAPSFWDDTGRVLQREGFGGAFLIPALAEGYAFFGDPRYLDKAESLCVYYSDLLAQQSFGTAAALDSCCIDKESAIPLLKGGLRLFELTGRRHWLDRAGDAAWYLSTWQWHQTNPLKKGSGLYRLGYDTFGGTSVSTSHHHMDAYALSYVPSLMKLSSLTGDPQWKERAEEAFRNGIQGMSDGNLALYGDDIRPRGSSDEGFVHTSWGRVTRGRGLWNDAFETTRWLVAWPCAFRLEVLRTAGFPGQK